MKIGDRVRFLNEKGGGKIVSIKSKGIIVVEDEDGFDIPVQSNDIVVIDNDDYDTSKIIEERKKKKDYNSSSSDDTFYASHATAATELLADEIFEREDGDNISVYLAYIPKNIKEFSTTNFECYIINDSNYYISYSLLKKDADKWSLSSLNVIEPNTKLLIDTIRQDDLNTLVDMTIQFIVYKRDQAFDLKMPCSHMVKINARNFFKLHSFVENDFFETPALIYTIIENDIEEKPLRVDAKDIKHAMSTNNAKERKDTCNSYARRYDDGQKQRNPFIIKHRGDDDIIVVDLHAGELLDTMQGMNNSDILNYQLDKFREVINQNINRKGQKIIFIHGKGEGVLRHSIIKELSKRYRRCEYQDASFQEYGYGATQVTIH